MDRRRVLTNAAGLAGLGLAGCTDRFGSTDDGTDPARPTVPADRDARVYVPSHRDGMAMQGTRDAGDYRVGLMYTYPHRFWIVTGTDTERVDVREEDTVHLMAVVFDAETNTVLPVGAGVSITIERDGEFVAEKAPWPMISQPMGFHYGDNYALDGDGTYDVTVTIGSIGAATFGALAGRFDERATTTFELEYSRSDRDQLEVRQFEDRRGDPGAVSMMDMGMLPLSQVPAPAELPGRVVGEGPSGDATVVVTAVDEAPFVEGDGSYLLVSPRTPYNRVPLPSMSLSATLSRGDEPVFDGRLAGGIEPTAGFHYGATVDAVEAGDELTVAVDSPPQMSRHEGYETAFVDMADVALTLE
jgi:hypothetical protein